MNCPNIGHEITTENVYSTGMASMFPKALYYKQLVR